jgi:hypothetical protein
MCHRKRVLRQSTRWDPACRLLQGMKLQQSSVHLQCCMHNCLLNCALRHGMQVLVHSLHYMIRQGATHGLRASCSTISSTEVCTAACGA